MPFFGSGWNPKFHFANICKKIFIPIILGDNLRLSPRFFKQIYRNLIQLQLNATQFL